MDPLYKGISSSGVQEVGILCSGIHPLEYSAPGVKAGFLTPGLPEGIEDLILPPCLGWESQQLLLEVAGDIIPLPTIEDL